MAFNWYGVLAAIGLVSSKNTINLSELDPPRESAEVKSIPRFCRKCGSELEARIYSSGRDGEYEVNGFCPKWYRDRTHDASIFLGRGKKENNYNAYTGEKL